MASDRGSTTSPFAAWQLGSSSISYCNRRQATARFRIVSPTLQNEDKNEGRVATLGDLLYADKAKLRVPEEEWVELVQRIARGEQSALRELYERTHRLVFTLIMRIVENRASAEELTLDVFHDVWRQANTYDEKN